MRNEKSSVKLLISVRNSSEARAALLGGADIIDAKEPERGALGAVELGVFRDIVACVGGRVPVSAALGDVDDEHPLRGQATAFADAGAAFVKIGFAGIGDPLRAAELVRAIDAVGDVCHVVPVAYADFDRLGSPDPSVLIEIAAKSGARAILLDTADKRGPSLRSLMTAAALRAWVHRVHSADLIAAVAGKISADDLLDVCDAGADIVGMRGAACENGRTGTVTSDRVHSLRARLEDGTHAVTPGWQ